ncbi:glycoside hydrolase family 113 [Microvirga pakistanensis]|uniref:glycoside hydrolase family 113 n=1 Tax=Microvirga pakistanensis TaxID=1682650 RepID=UPI00106C3E7C|nr:calcium-binding protein [Microvirga pakistanensis]
MSLGQILEWESITQPSYWAGQALSPGGQAAMAQIAATGANTLTLIPNFFQTDKFSNSAALKLGDPNIPWDSESDSFEQVKQTILNAKALGMNVVLKPHLETDNRVWRAELAPTDPKAWFDSYKAIMVEYARVAQEAGAAMICVGTEIDSMIDPTKLCSDGKTYTEKWGEIIDAVREVYSGKVTYAATYWTVNKVGFWDKVDYIGVDAYYPLSTVDDPTVDQMVDAWVKPHFNPWIRDDLLGGKSIVDYYKALSAQYGKQVIFTEVGYRSVQGGNKDPGVFGSGGTVDLQEQMDAYTALFRVMENYGGQWLAGSFMWSYYSFAHPMDPPSEGGAGVSWTDYTTQDKPANVTIRDHYSNPTPTTGLVWNGTAGADNLDGGYHNDTLNGGAGNDTLWGGKGNDKLNGGTSADSMEGGAGNDIYYVDSTGDRVVETASGGTADRVYTSVSHNLAAYVEQLYATGSASLNLTGNTLANTLTGNAGRNKLSGGSGNDKLYGGTGNDTLSGGSGHDTLDGGTGRDVLTGGTGNDTFVFKDRPGSTRYDTITDYNKRYDSIHLDNKSMPKLGGAGKLSSSKFVLGTAAKDAGDRVIYDRSTGKLYYDVDGTGAIAKQLIVILKNKPGLAASEFLIV